MSGKKVVIIIALLSAIASTSLLLKSETNPDVNEMKEFISLVAKVCNLLISLASSLASVTTIM